MNTQRTSGHSRDDLWFHTQGEEDQTLTKCSGIFGRDAEPTVSLFTHIRGGKKTTTLSIVQVVGSHTIEYMEIGSAYNPKFQPIPIPQLLSHYPNAVTKEVFSTFDKQKVGVTLLSSFTNTRSIWDFLVGSSIHHPPWSPQSSWDVFFSQKTEEPSRRYRYGRPKVLLPWPVFPHQSWDQVPPLSTARHKKQAKPGFIHLTDLRKSIISFRKILDQVVVWRNSLEMKHFHFHLNNWSMFFFHC